MLSNNDLMGRLELCATRMKHWNIVAFGHVGWKIVQCMGAIDRLQREPRNEGNIQALRGKQKCLDSFLMRKSCEGKNQGQHGR